MRFSERKGLRPIKNVIQTEDMDQGLRIGLWNALTLFYWEDVNQRWGQLSQLWRSIWMNYFKHPVDAIPADWVKIHSILRKYFFGCRWYEAYDFLEFVPCNFEVSFDRNENSEFRKLL